MVKMTSKYSFPCPISAEVTYTPKIHYKTAYLELTPKCVHFFVLLKKQKQDKFILTHRSVQFLLLFYAHKVFHTFDNLIFTKNNVNVD